MTLLTPSIQILGLPDGEETNSEFVEANQEMMKMSAQYVPAGSTLGAAPTLWV